MKKRENNLKGKSLISTEKLRRYSLKIFTFLIQAISLRHPQFQLKKISSHKFHQSSFLEAMMAKKLQGFRENPLYLMSPKIMLCNLNDLSRTCPRDYPAVSQSIRRQ